MQCRVDLKSDPISLKILAADGTEHKVLDDTGHNGFVTVPLGPVLHALVNAWRQEASTRTTPEAQVAAHCANELEDLLVSTGNKPPAPEVPDQTPVSDGSFREQLRAAINRCCMENGSDTPDFILADYLRSCLSAFDIAVTARSEWYGRKDFPVQRVTRQYKEETPPAPALPLEALNEEIRKSCRSYVGQLITADALHNIQRAAEDAVSRVVTNTVFEDVRVTPDPEHPSAVTITVTFPEEPLVVKLSGEDTTDV